MKFASTTLLVGSMVLGVVAPSSVLGYHMPPPGSVVRREATASENAIAGFVEVDPITCADGSAGTLRTSLSLFISDQVSVNSTVNNGAPQIQREVFASASIADSCTGAERNLQGSTDLTSEELVQEGVQSATLTTTIELFENDVFVSTVDVALTLTGVGTIDRHFTTTVTQQQGETSYRDDASLFRNAVASGMVNLDGRELVDSLDSAVLYTLNYRTTVVRGTSERLLPPLPIVPGPGRILTDLATRSETAVARFNQVAPIVCADGSEGVIETNVTVQANPGVRIENGVRTVTGTIQGGAVRTNTCTQEVIGASATTPVNGFRQMDVRSAMLTTTLDLTTAEGASFGSLEVDLTWTGVGPTDRFLSLDETGNGTRTERVRSQSEVRNAVVSGSVALDGVEYTPFFQSGELVLERQRQITTELQ